MNNPALAALRNAVNRSISEGAPVYTEIPAVQKTIIREYTIQLQIYHDEIVGRLQYAKPCGAIEESSLYSLSELENLIGLWTCDALLGSFGIGTQLHKNAQFRIVQK